MKTFVNIMFVLIAGLWACEGIKEKDQKSGALQQAYTCPMHHQIVQANPGDCPICGMELVPVSQHGDKTEVQLNESQIELANITVQRASIQRIGRRVRLNGTLRADETQTEMVSARIPGRLDRLFVKETGMQIRKGQAIYELYSEPLLTYQQEYVLALSQVEANNNPRSQSYLAAAKKKLWLFGMTAEQINTLAMTKTVNPRIQFVAPASGTLTEIKVSEGQYVDEGTVIYRLEKLSTLWAEAEVYPDEAALIKPGDPVTIVMSGLENQPVQSRVVFVSPEYRQGSQVLLIRASVPNPEFRLRPGMQAEVEFEHSQKSALTLPLGAVIRSEEGSLVYKKTGKGTFRAFMVSTGIENVNHVEITKGLEEGDTVVATGAYLLYSHVVLINGSLPMSGHVHGLEQQASLGQGPTMGEGRRPHSIDPGFAKQLTALIIPYFKIKDALVASNAHEASSQAINVAKALTQIDQGLLLVDDRPSWMENQKRMEQSIKLIQATQDIEIQRSAFSQLTQALYVSLKRFEVRGLHVFYQYCPMAFDNQGAYWLSQEEKIHNPYFGDQMDGCGETKEILK